MATLAVVIPAYKKIYFEKALAALATQTNKQFTVYVGDDNSPQDLKEICDQFQSSLEIRYTRFDDNVGGLNLVHQWNRCIGLTQNEEWLWLYGDDDIADNQCVAKFYEILERDKGKVDIYRFNTVIIDEEGRQTLALPVSPDYETSVEMAYHLLIGERGSCMQDQIFSRKVFEETGGFVYTEYAQAADWATSILFSKKKGIGIIPGAKFYWRFSGANISSRASAQKKKMIKGHLQFIEWVANHFRYLQTEPGSISYTMMLKAARINLKSVMVYHYKGFDAGSVVQIARVMRKKLGMSYKQIIYDLLIILINTNKIFQSIFKTINPLRKKLTVSAKPW